MLVWRGGRGREGGVDDGVPPAVHYHLGRLGSCSSGGRAVLRGVRGELYRLGIRLGTYLMGSALQSPTTGHLHTITSLE